MMTKQSYLPLNGLPPLSTGAVKRQRLIWLMLWWFILFIEVLIYSSFTILAHLSQVDGKLPFRSSAVVLCTEVLKIIISMVLLLPEVFRDGLSSHLPSACHSLLFLVPAVVYSINNNLGMSMQEHMDPTTYQVLGNLKVGTTAVLYRIIIQRKLCFVQWFSLFLLAVAGVCDSYSGIRVDAKERPFAIHVTPAGLLMMLVYCFLSGFAGVYTEYILKKHYQSSLHMQNILLYLFGIIINTCIWQFQSENSLADVGSSLFEGFSVYTWIIVVTQALNGLIMSAIMKHGSNITRLFVISCAMLVTTILSVVIFSLELSITYILAFVLVVVALYLYHR